ncbi:MAG: 1,4-dihydroxy-2-naphthoate polyprenyltransferase [Candidatus Marinimicrobia bacterium]|nr:1,4-dihydroxy-2-naphthoate polyprenyltransferase [Candidatus Neomarinimicrobiota bacterium]
MSEQTTPSKPEAFWLAARPKTLPAAVMPVLIGTAVAYHQEVFHLLPALAAMFCALLIQIGTNYANDLLDYQAGTDNDFRLGPERAVASKWLTEREMLIGTVTVFMATVPMGMYLIYVAGLPVLVIGLVSIAAGIAYTGGPYPLAYNGLGDLFVFIFFGIVATVGTYFVQAESVSLLAFLASLPAGGLTTAILVINNYRDIDTDKTTNKNTLAVILGKAGTRIEYVILLVISYLIPVILYFIFHFSSWILLPWLTLPLAIQLCRMLFAGMQGRQLNALLEKTARLTLVYGLLFSIALII